jgi:hypothetical protein
METFGYAKVEEALAKVFKTNKRTLLALRGRLKSFQRAGLTPQKPGRGKVIKYTVYDVYDWAWALALADFGLDPQAICSLVQKGYFKADYLGVIEKFKDDNWFFAAFPYVLKASELSEHKISVPFVMIKGSELSAKTILGLGGRLALIDMTGLKKSVDDAQDYLLTLQQCARVHRFGSGHDISVTHFVPP